MRIKPNILTNKKLIINTLNTFILLLIISSCQEPYEFKDLENNQQIPVFNATLTNVPLLNKFSLYYASPFGSDRKIGIGGASISILVNETPLFNLIEDFPGRYLMPDNAPELLLNQAYSVIITMPNGDILKSEPQFLLDTITIGRTYINEHNRTRLIKNESGNYAEVTDYGISVYADITQTNEDAYIRSKSHYYIQSQISSGKEIKSYENGNNYTIEFTVQYDTVYDVLSGSSNNDFPQITEYMSSVNYTSNELLQNPLFLVADKNYSDFTRYTEDVFVQWIVPVDIYRNERNIYNYYLEGKKQIDAEFQIYDPIPNQLLGNMHNETHPEKVVLGLMDVSAVNRKYMRIYPVNTRDVHEYRYQILRDTIIRAGKYINHTTIDTTKIDTIFTK